MAAPGLRYWRLSVCTAGLPVYRYDRAFRRKMHVAGDKGCWRTLDVPLHAACLLEDPAARLD